MNFLFFGGEGCPLVTISLANNVKSIKHQGFLAFSPPPPFNFTLWTCVTCMYHNPLDEHGQDCWGGLEESICHLDSTNQCCY